MSSSSKTVKFRRESPSGGSYLDHQRSDSGVGSFSDSEGRGPYADRSYTGSDYDSIYALQEALNNELASKKDWMKKTAELDAMVIRAHKEIKETEARMRALQDHVEELTDERDKLLKTNKELTEENAKLRDDLNKDKDPKDKDKDKDKRSRRKSSSPPLMSGANGVGDGEKPKRSSSKHRSRESTGRAEREMDRDMDRLRKRFDARGDESDATGKSSNSTKSHRSRRDSYVEPLGQAAPRPQVHAQVPPSPSTRQYAYGSGPFPPQTQYAQPGNVPRVVHPQVVVSYSEASYDEEDGLYHPHPLPKQPRSQDRRR